MLNFKNISLKSAMAQQRH